VETTGQVAQLVEHRTENPGVGGSIPPLSIVNYPARNKSFLLPSVVGKRFPEVQNGNCRFGFLLENPAPSHIFWNRYLRIVNIG
jgi:hypothetical protein